jgi:WS/DGAT/MGAT family acyltransferase
MAKKRYLNALDRVMLAAETRESMIHVGALVPFAPPEDAPRDFLRDLMEEVRRATQVYPPWNWKLRFPNVIASPLQAWVEDEEFDVEYHVRRSALPSPGDERELGVLVSRLHSNKLDFNRPPWEVHFIEGLEGGRFALYFKVHHALVDGYTGMRILQRSLSSDPDDRATPLFFARPPEPRPPPDDAAPTLDHLLQGVREQIGATKDVGKALFNVLRPKKDRALVSPLRAPTSVLNQRVSRNRRFATQRFDLARLKRVAKSTSGTLNDVVLALVAAALRRLLDEQGNLPEKALVAMLPVNVRPKDDPGGGNAVGAILASLATDIDDPVQRLDAIVLSTRRAKEQLQGMSRNAILQFSALSLAPMVLQQIPGAVGRVRPAFNIIVSNVPGAQAPLHFRGWRAEALYPVSIPFHGYGLNVTVISYADTLDFGFIGCRDGLPHLQRLAVYAGQALAELETKLG